MNKFITITYPILCVVVILLLISLVALIEGNIELKGLKLSGPIKSVAEHEHCTYDNDFIAGTYFVGDQELINGSAIRAKDIRAARGSVSAYWMMNETVLYNHGPVVFTEYVEYPTKIDKNGKEVIDLLGVPMFHASGKLAIRPDYDNKRINIMGAYIDKEGVHNIADSEIDRIVDKIKQQLVPAKNAGNSVYCGEGK